MKEQTREAIDLLLRGATRFGGVLRQHFKAKTAPDCETGSMVEKEVSRRGLAALDRRVERIASQLARIEKHADRGGRALTIALDDFEREYNALSRGAKRYCRRSDAWIASQRKFTAFALGYLRGLANAPQGVKRATEAPAKAESPKAKEEPQKAPQKPATKEPEGSSELPTAEDCRDRGVEAFKGKYAVVQAIACCVHAAARDHGVSPKDFRITRARGSRLSLTVRMVRTGRAMRFTGTTTAKGYRSACASVSAFFSSLAKAAKKDETPTVKPTYPKTRTVQTALASHGLRAESTMPADLLALEFAAYTMTAADQDRIADEHRAMIERLLKKGTEIDPRVLAHYNLAPVEHPPVVPEEPKLTTEQLSELTDEQKELLKRLETMPIDDAETEYQRIAKAARFLGSGIDAVFKGKHRFAIVENKREITALKARNEDLDDAKKLSSLKGTAHEGKANAVDYWIVFPKSVARSEAETVLNGYLDVLDAAGHQGRSDIVSLWTKTMRALGYSDALIRANHLKDAAKRIMSKRRAEAAKESTSDVKWVRVDLEQNVVRLKFGRKPAAGSESTLKAAGYGLVSKGHESPYWRATWSQKARDAALAVGANAADLPEIAAPKTVEKPAPKAEEKPAEAPAPVAAPTAEAPKPDVNLETMAKMVAELLVRPEGATTGEISAAGGGTPAAVYKALTGLGVPIISGTQVNPTGGGRNVGTDNVWQVRGVDDNGVSAKGVKNIRAVLISLGLPEVNVAVTAEAAPTQTPEPMAPQTPSARGSLFRSIAPPELDDIRAKGCIIGRGNKFSGDPRESVVFFGTSIADVIHNGEDVSRYVETSSEMLSLWAQKRAAEEAMNAADKRFREASEEGPGRQPYKVQEKLGAEANRLQKQFFAIQKDVHKKFDALKKATLEAWQKAGATSYIVEIPWLTGGVHYRERPEGEEHDFDKHSSGVGDEIGFPRDCTVKASDIVRVHVVLNGKVIRVADATEFFPPEAVSTPTRPATILSSAHAEAPEAPKPADKSLDDKQERADRLFALLTTRAPLTTEVADIAGEDNSTTFAMLQKPRREFFVIGEKWHATHGYSGELVWTIPSRGSWGGQTTPSNAAIGGPVQFKTRTDELAWSEVSEVCKALHLPAPSRSLIGQPPTNDLVTSARHMARMIHEALGHSVKNVQVEGVVSRKADDFHANQKVIVRYEDEAVKFTAEVHGWGWDMTGSPPVTFECEVKGGKGIAPETVKAWRNLGGKYSPEEMVRRVAEAITQIARPAAVPIVPVVVGFTREASGLNIGTRELVAGFAALGQKHGFDFGGELCRIVGQDAEFLYLESVGGAAVNVRKLTRAQFAALQAYYAVGSRVFSYLGYGTITKGPHRDSLPTGASHIVITITLDSDGSEHDMSTNHLKDRPGANGERPDVGTGMIATARDNLARHYADIEQKKKNAEYERTELAKFPPLKWGKAEDPSTYLRMANTNAEKRAVTDGYEASATIAKAHGHEQPVYYWRDRGVLVRVSSGDGSLAVHSVTPQEFGDRFAWKDTNHARAVRSLVERETPPTVSATSPSVSPEAATQAAEIMVKLQNAIAAATPAAPKQTEAERQMAAFMADLGIE